MAAPPPAPGGAAPPPAGGFGRTNLWEEEWVQQAMRESLRDSGGQAGGGGDPRPALGPAPSGGGGWWGGTLPLPWGAVHGNGTGFGGNPDSDLQRALAESAREAESRQAQENVELLTGGLSEEAAFQRALRESAVATEEAFGVRRMMGPEGPFYPAGLANSGNSCFWNALLQALFAATPVFRGALFQLDPGAFGSSTGGAGSVLAQLRDLFAEMDMGLARAIDAGELYRAVFQRAEEADVSEQVHRLFELAAGGPGPLKAVCQELFSGDLYEQLRNGRPRRVPLELCQLDLCVTRPAPLESVLEEHTRDVQGSIECRSYRLPPVLWLNLDRFVYDRTAQRGRKRQVRLTFPEILNAWMLVPPEEEWVKKLRASAQRRRELTQALQSNREEVLRWSSPTLEASPASDVEDTMQRLVEQQEEVLRELVQVEAEMTQLGADQELLYNLQAVIVHRGRVDSGHYYTYARSPVKGSAEWVCLNDATVTLCSGEEMRSVCEGTDGEPVEGQTLPLVEEGSRQSSRGVSLGSAGTAPISTSPAAAPPEPTSPEAPKPPTDVEEPMVDSKLSPVPSLGSDGQAPHLDKQAAPTVEKQVVSQCSHFAPPRSSTPPRGRCCLLSVGKAFWNSMSSILGCLPKGGNATTVSSPGPHQQQQQQHHAQEARVSTPPRRYPAATGAGAPASRGHNPAAVTPAEEERWLQEAIRASLRDVNAQAQPVLPRLATPPASPLPGAAVGLPAAAAGSRAAPAVQEEESTAARCLIYVRSSPSASDTVGLVGEVRRRMPSALQERIDKGNTELLRKSVELVAEDFIRCVRQLTALAGARMEGKDEDERDKPSDALQECLERAERIRTEGGMPKARMYLLRCCWRAHVPWLPEELCPTAMPPDFRMHYGSAAKRMLLDALIKRGQHDVASLIVAGTPNSDGFVPKDVEDWLTNRNF